MKAIFWIIIAFLYFVLALISFYFNLKIDKEYLKAKDDFKKDYGFRTYGIFELLSKFTKLSTWVNFVGFILASAAATISILF